MLNNFKCFAGHKRKKIMEETDSLWFLSKLSLNHTQIWDVPQANGLCFELDMKSIWVNMHLFLSQMSFKLFFFHITWYEYLTSSSLIFRPLPVWVTSVLLTSLKHRTLSNIRSKDQIFFNQGSEQYFCYKLELKSFLLSLMYLLY